MPHSYSWISLWGRWSSGMHLTQCRLVVNLSNIRNDTFKFPHFVIEWSYMKLGSDIHLHRAILPWDLSLHIPSYTITWVRWLFSLCLWRVKFIFQSVSLVNHGGNLAIFLLLLGVFHTHFCVGASISESGNVQVMNMYVCRLGLILSARLVVPL